MLSDPFFLQTYFGVSREIQRVRQTPKKYIGETEMNLGVCLSKTCAVKDKFDQNSAKLEMVIVKTGLSVNKRF